jgi:hypothetical protein
VLQTMSVHSLKPAATEPVSILVPMTVRAAPQLSVLLKITKQSANVHQERMETHTVSVFQVRPF